MDDFEKFVNDEITEVEFLERTEKLSPEEKAKVDAKIAAEKSLTLAEIKALRKEKNRIANQVEKPIVDTGAKFRDEQVAKAKARLKTEFGIEDMTPYDEQFKRLDEGHVDSDLIFDNLKKIYAYVNPDSLLDARSKIKEFETNAEDFIDKMAQANGSGDGTNEGKKFAPEVNALVKKSKLQGTPLTPEQAERYLRGGLGRTI